MGMINLDRIKGLIFRSRTVGSSFSESDYLSLYPDVMQAVRAGAFSSGREHWERFGRAEGRLPSRVTVAAPASSVAQLDDRFVTVAPTSQNIIDLFQGQWSTSFDCEPGLIAKPGHADLFNDARIKWASDRLGPFSGRSIIELGPLEGAHTRMLEALGAESIVAIESNTRAFLKCLCVKELFFLNKARFLLGDFNDYLETCQKADVIVASGVLYHMTEPVELLRRICDKSDAFFLWTHYYDARVIASRNDCGLFQPCDMDAETGLRGARRLYPEQALSWGGFSGGAQHYAVWMERQSIINFLEREGFECESGFETPDHPNGPAFAVCARRRRG